jgi:hypothetical protein
MGGTALGPAGAIAGLAVASAVGTGFAAKIAFNKYKDKKRAKEEAMIREYYLLALMGLLVAFLMLAVVSIGFIVGNAVQQDEDDLE